MNGQEHRLFGPAVVAFGLVLYGIAFVGGVPAGDPSRWFMAYFGAGVALAGMWLAGLDRLFPRADAVRVLVGGVVAGLGGLPLLAVLPALNPASPPMGRVVFLLVGLPMVVAGAGLAGALAPIERALVARGIRPARLLGGLVVVSAALAAFAVAALMAAHREGAPAAALAIGVGLVTAGGLLVRLAWPIADAWREALEKALAALWVSAFAAAVTAIALFSTPIAWPGALLLLWIVGQGCWDVGQAFRRAVRPTPPPPLPDPAAEPGPVRAVTSGPDR